MPFSANRKLCTIIVGHAAWRAEIGGLLRQAGHEVIEADDVDDFGATLYRCDVGFIDLELNDPLQIVARLWWAEPDLPIVLCGEHIEAALLQSASEAGLLIASHVPSLGQLSTLVTVLAGPLGKSAALRSRAVAAAMGSLSELGLDSDETPGTGFEAAAVEIIADLFHADVVSVMRDDGHNSLRTVANIGLDDVIGSIAHPDGLGSYVFRTGIARLIIGDAAATPAPVIKTQSAVRASMVVPVTTPGGGKRGVLAVAKCSPHALYTPRDLELCGAVGTLLGQLIARFEAVQEAHELQHRLATTERLTVLGELAAGVVHDISAPLGAVRANTEILIDYLTEMRPALEREEAATPGLTAILDDLPALMCETYEGLTTACNVITQMKQVVRLGNGNGEEVDVSATVDSAIRMLRSRVQTPVVIVADDHCYVRGVPIELLQVMTNLITNANDTCVERRALAQERQELFRGRIEIAVRALNDGVVISVDDNGMGMDEALVARIWDPLFTTKPSGVGTGLGMGVVQRIIRQHGGDIEVDSAPGRGTSFRLFLQRAHPTGLEHRTAHLTAA